MSGSENGQDGTALNTTEPASSQSVPKLSAPRSASPAKRSAGEMEESQTDFDHALASIRDANSMDTQETAALSSIAPSSLEGTMTNNTSATSFQSEDPPAYPAEEKSPERGLRGAPHHTPSIDEQVSQVHVLLAKPVEEGDRGVVVSTKWLVRVLSRTTEGRESTDFPKEAREGEIGPLDCSDLVTEDGFSGPALKDVSGQDYIPLKPGLGSNVDIEILPYEAYGLIVGWYGMATGQKAIVRFAHDTAPSDATQSNLQYELYPPIFTVRKVVQPGQDGEQKGHEKTRQAAILLRQRKDLRNHGQKSPDDAPRLVSSRFERYQHFLTRAKDSARIPMQTKVKTWRGLKPANIATDVPDSSPPDDNPDHTKPTLDALPAKLVVDVSEWEMMEVGKDVEHVDARDETSNDKYNGGSTMDTFALFADQTIILEEQIGGPAGGEYASDQKKVSLFNMKKNNAASKPRSGNTSGRTSPAPGGGILTRGRSRRDGRTRGTVGLSNLGNTCYMNSALQCIRSVEELAVYFLENRYKAEINATNPLGHKGAMATKYAEVLNNIYGIGASSSFSPIGFKNTLGRIMPTFSGFGQQDSQEFLSFLVDALHEDLNRIEKKPYLENPDSDDSRVSDPEYIVELGEKYRANHRARNDSIAMDLFSGFYKNTMECPVCDKISVTFDPYSLLTVQLPIANTLTHTFTFVPLRGTPVNHDLDVDKSSTIRDLKHSIASKYPGVDASKLWMTEVYSRKIYKVFDDASTLAEASIQAGDHIFLFELEYTPTYLPSPLRQSYPYYRRETVPDMDSEAAERFAVPVFHRKKTRFSDKIELALHPLYITVTREEARDFVVIQKKLLMAVAQMTSRPILMEAAAEEEEEEEEEDEDKKDDAGDVETIETTQDDTARVSDHSVNSEDGYINVSLDGITSSSSTLQSQEKTSDETSHERGAKAPSNFMDPAYSIPRILQNQLFYVNCAKSADSGFSSFEDKNVRAMYNRVKQASRRASLESSSSDDSTNSDGSTQINNGGVVESEVEDEDVATTAEEPSVTNEESPLTLADSTSDSEPPPVGEVVGIARSGRRKGNAKGNKFKQGKVKRKDMTYSRRDRRQARNAQPSTPKALERHHHHHHHHHTREETQDNSGSYYIQVGECIVLDWHSEAFESLFEGDSDDDNDLRGYWLSTETGAGLPVFDDPAVREKRERREARRKNGLTLEDCFAETGKREKLSEDNAWYCNRCKELRQATKTLEIWTLPDILVVHLKRFGGNRRFQDKIDVSVDYPVEGLDLEEKVGRKEEGKSYTYDLFAIDNHYGGLGGGHYTAAAKNFFDGQWYDYNDSHCSRTGEAPRRSAAAYLLFYRRRSDQPLGPQYLQELVNKYRHPGMESEAEESDSGEGRLGDHSSILHGSSSNSAGAGVVEVTTTETQSGRRAVAGGNGSLGVAGARLHQRTNRMRDEDEDEGIGLEDDDDVDDAEANGEGHIGSLGGKTLHGPARPPHLQDMRGENTWGFDSLHNNQEADGSVDMLLDNVADNASTAAEMDSLAGTSGDLHTRIQEDFYPDVDKEGEQSLRNASPVEWNDPEDSFTFGEGQEHSFYSDAPEQQQQQHQHQHHFPAGEDALHVEDAGMNDGEDDDDPPAVDIHLDDREG